MGAGLIASGNLTAPSRAVAAPVEKLVRPRALKPGDTVGLITPSSYVSDPDRLMLAERTVRHFGLVPKFGKNVRRRDGYLGGTIEERLEDLHAMFRDPQVKGVFAIRGGYGAAQLLDRIDYELIHSNPKVLLGYSDIPAADGERSEEHTSELQSLRHLVCRLLLEKKKKKKKQI